MTGNPWTPEWEIPAGAEPSPPSQPSRRRRFVVGALIALAGHVPSSGLGLLTLYMFAFFATPDTPAFMFLLVLLLEAVLFTGCVVWGGLQLAGGDRSLGLGLLVGWAAGVAGAVLGTLLLFVIAELAS